MHTRKPLLVASGGITPRILNLCTILTILKIVNLELYNLEVRITLRLVVAREVVWIQCGVTVPGSCTVSGFGVMLNIQVLMP
jgi:hypothetical protein